MKFSDIPAHETAKERIRAMVDADRIPHALLLEGPTGIGKFALARATAQYIHCENRRNGDSCGECPSCLQHASFNHIDTHFVFPIAKKKSGSPSFCDDFIEEWRRKREQENPFSCTVTRKIGNTWYIVETECDGDEPLPHMVKRLIFSDKEAV